MSRSDIWIRIHYPCTSFKHTLMYNIVFKHQLIWIRTLGEEAFCITRPPTQKSKTIGLEVVVLGNYKLYQTFL